MESLKRSKDMNFVERMQFMEGKDIFKFEGKTLTGKELNSEDTKMVIPNAFGTHISAP